MLTALLLATGLSFSSPVHYEVTLAGNFGEPRPNHFHGGIDVKTGGVEKKPIYSVADGYVSRVTTGLLGFGNAVYVTHPNGVTTVYCHLRSFSRQIQTLVDRYRHEHQCSFTTDARFSPLDCPVSEGQFLALSGNTGASKAPHLHLEFHDTKTWAMLDPLKYLGQDVKDNTPPQAHGFMAYPQYGEGVFCGGSGKQTCGMSQSGKVYHYTAWGKVGFGLWANDYSETTYNHLGVYSTRLLCDGNEVFSSRVDSIPAFSNRQINIWGDYHHYLRSHVWYLKSFIEPGCRLDFLKTDNNKGIIDFNEERDYEMEYILADTHGNEAHYKFIVEGRKTKLSVTNERQPSDFIPCNTLWEFCRPGIQLVIPIGALGNNVKMNYRQLSPLHTSHSTLLTNQKLYTFSTLPCPLAVPAELNIYVGKQRVSQPEKLYLRSSRTKYIAGRFHDGWLSGMIRELSDTYEVAYDNQAPRILPSGSPESWRASGTIRFALSDGDSGLKSYKVFIDGRFIYFAPLEKSNVIECRLKQSAVTRTGKSHNLKITVTDNCHNNAVYSTRFIW